MKPRAVLILALALGLLAAPLVTGAQQVARIPRVGVLADPPDAPNLRLEAFRKGLRELGYVEGQSVLLEIRQWDGVSGHTPALVSELIRISVDVLVVPTTGAAVSATRFLTIYDAAIRWKRAHRLLMDKFKALVMEATDQLGNGRWEIYPEHSYHWAGAYLVRKNG